MKRRRLAEPSWHRRERRQRTAARTIIRVAQSARLLQRHHSAMPAGGHLPAWAATGMGHEQQDTLSASSLADATLVGTLGGGPSEGSDLAPGPSVAAVPMPALGPAAAGNIASAAAHRRALTPTRSALKSTSLCTAAVQSRAPVPPPPPPSRASSRGSSVAQREPAFTAGKQYQSQSQAHSRRRSGSRRRREQQARADGAAAGQALPSTGGAGAAGGEELADVVDGPGGEYDDAIAEVGGSDYSVGDTEERLSARARFIALQRHADESATLVGADDPLTKAARSKADEALHALRRATPVARRQVGVQRAVARKAQQIASHEAKLADHERQAAEERAIIADLKAKHAGLCTDLAAIDELVDLEVEAAAEADAKQAVAFSVSPGSSQASVSGSASLSEAAVQCLVQEGVAAEFDRLSAVLLQRLTPIMMAAAAIQAQAPQHPSQSAPSRPLATLVHGAAASLSTSSPEPPQELVIDTGVTHTDLQMSGLKAAGAPPAPHHRSATGSASVGAQPTTGKHAPRPASASKTALKPFSKEAKAKDKDKAKVKAAAAAARASEAGAATTEEEDLEEDGPAEEDVDDEVQVLSATLAVAPPALTHPNE